MKNKIHILEDKIKITTEVIKQMNVIISRCCLSANSMHYVETMGKLQEYTKFLLEEIEK